MNEVVRVADSNLAGLEMRVWPVKLLLSRKDYVVSHSESKPTEKQQGL